MRAGRGSRRPPPRRRSLEVRYSEVSGRWASSASGGMDESIAKKWGVGSYNCFMILTAALNGGLIQIEKDNPDYNPVAEKVQEEDPRPGGPRPRPAPSARARGRPFREWVWKDEDRASMLADIYNRKLNRVAPRAYSGDYLSLPGDVARHPAQEAPARRRGAHHQDSEGTLIAHTVGAGKTFTASPPCTSSSAWGEPASR